MAEQTRGDFEPEHGSEISEFNLPDLEKARANNYPWVGEADKTKKYLEEKIKEAKDKITKGEDTEAEEAKLRSLQERWQRLEALSSEKRGANDRDLNALAFSKYEADQGKKSAIDYNDAGRVELLADLRREVSEQGLVKSGEGADTKKEAIPLPEQFSQGPLAKKEENALVKRGGLVKSEKDDNIIDLKEGKDFTVLDLEKSLPAHKPDALTGRPKREALPAHEQEALEDKRGKVALPAHEAPLPAVTPEKEKAPQKEKLVFANISAMIEAAAWDAANAKMTEGKEKMGDNKKRGFFGKIGNAMGNIGKMVWKYNWFYEAYKRKEYEKAKKRIYKDYNEGRIDIDKLNILAAEDEQARQGKHTEAMGAVFDRFASEYDEAVESGAGGEEKLKIEDENIKQEARNLIRDYAVGSISQSDLARRHNELLGKIGGKDLDVKNEIDNLLIIAEKIKNSDSNDKARDALALDLEIIRGKARGGVKTEAELNRLERVIDKMKKTRGLSWINETTLAVGATAAYCLGRKISQRFAYSKAANIASFGGTAAISGAYAGVLENKRVKEERAQHSRERAKGKEFAPGARRRQEMETFRHETAEAQSISRQLQENFYSSYDIRGERKLKDLSDAELAGALGNLADLEARLSLSNAHKIDLISYSDLAEVEKERTRLLLLRSQIKADLKNKYPNGFKVNGENKDVNFAQDLAEVRKQELINGKEAEAGKEAVEGIKEKDRLFNKMKAKRVRNKVVQAAVTGLILGATFQEIQAAVDDNTQSLLEGIMDKDLDARHQTALEGLRDWVASFKGSGASGSEMAAIMIGGQEIQVGLPKGADLRDPEGDGIYSLFYHDKEVCNNVSFDSDGGLTDEAKRALADHGVRISEAMSKEAGEGALAGATPEQGATKFVEDHPDLFKKITHKLWYDNDTPKPEFDHNELRLDWGGKGGVGVNENGDYVFKIDRMESDGSWHGEFSADAKEAAKNGELKLLLSANHATENQVIEIPINADYEAIIPKGSEAAKMLLTQDAEGHALFLGDHAEVSQMMGQTNKEGAEMIKVLATHTGENAPIIPAAPKGPIPIFEIPPRTDLPPFIPVVGRRPMEEAMGGKEAPPVVVPYYSREAKKGHEPSAELSPYRNTPEQAEKLAAKLGQEQHPGDYERLQKKINVLKKEELSEAEKKNLEKNLQAYNGKNKADLNLSAFREQEIQRLEKLAALIPETERGKGRYDHVLERLQDVKNFENLSAKKKKALERDLTRYNRRYKTNLMMPEFLVQERDRCYRQIENILIERAKVGEKPFNPEFYEKAPLVKGLNEAEEVVVVLDSPIGDSVVTVPAVIALDRYFQENKIADKKIKVVASAGQMGLLKSLEEQYQGRLELVNMDKMQEYFSKQGDKKRFVINTHKSFQDYKTLGISDQEAKDLSRVMSVTWDSWLKEEVPQSKDRMHQYYPIPMRIMRNFEVMLGQKLFKDIRNIDHFLEKSKNFEQEAKELREKYKIPEGEDIVVISAGAGVTPKEYKPEHWREVITGICEKYPDTRILFIDDPRPKKQEIYGKMVDDQLVAEKKYKVTRVNEGLDKMNTIMSMSKFSITPDTGLGHYSAALGVPNIMLILGDPVQWSEKQTVRIMHPQSHRVYGEGKGIFHEAWAQPDDYYVTMKDGSKVGASDIKPAEILKEVDKLMEKKI